MSLPEVVFPGFRVWKNPTQASGLCTQKVDLLLSYLLHMGDQMVGKSPKVHLSIVKASLASEGNHQTIFQ